MQVIDQLIISGVSASVKAELWSVYRCVNTIPKYSYEWTSQQVYPKVRACTKCVLVCERSKVMTAEKVRAGLVWTGERGRGSGSDCTAASLSLQKGCLISTHIVLVK